MKREIRGNEETKVLLDKNGNKMLKKLQGNKDISAVINKTNKLIWQG